MENAKKYAVNGAFTPDNKVNYTVKFFDGEMNTLGTKQGTTLDVFNEETEEEDVNKFFNEMYAELEMTICWID